MRYRLGSSGNGKPAGLGSSQRTGGAELSLVIPVYNGSRTVGRLVDEIFAALAEVDFEIILVNDGSADESEEVCAALVEEHPDRLILLQLTRNFGEHNAVMAGMKHASGDYIAILDDDGQNAARDVAKMYWHARNDRFDVVYSRYGRRKHSWFRILGSWFNDRVANVLLKKPRGLYLSSFKVINRTVADQVIRYAGPFPYVDGLILHVTCNIGQLNVEHLPRRAGRSGYTLSKLIGLWLNMSIVSSLTPLRFSIFAGFFMTLSSILILAATSANRIWLNPYASIATPCLVAAMLCAMGIQLVALGIVGEYVGRTFLHQSGMPQSVVRYIKQGDKTNRAKPDSPGVVTG